MLFEIGNHENGVFGKVNVFRDAEIVVLPINKIISYPMSLKKGLGVATKIYFEVDGFRDTFIDNNIFPTVGDEVIFINGRACALYSKNKNLLHLLHREISATLFKLWPIQYALARFLDIFGVNYLGGMEAAAALTLTQAAGKQASMEITAIHYSKNFEDYITMEESRKKLGIQSDD
ncbi:hypothetical protein HW571_28600 [Agrobacterium genomosp. 3]|uniref:hypothetical protein n=1 Tax=Agrobacterium tomkonis TaxID=1183410 RepID=UPI001CD914E6|nr:hypothetical protein [Agrobacterium tomkonis]MCA1879880.1 hypothetical protein [Agrobacterium tumefaciens]MCA1895151.1 hypothetical protein [Agrobacterium tomkonis]